MEPRDRTRQVSKLYRVAYADPPWRYANYGMAKHGAAKAHYDEMSTAELCSMRVQEIMDPRGSLLAIWTTGPKAAEGHHIELAQAWGYRLVTKLMTWVKCQRACTGCGHDWDDHMHVLQRPPGMCQWHNDANKAKRRHTKRDCACKAFGVDPYFGTGNYTGGGTEDLWLGRRGNWTASKQRHRRDVRHIVIAPLPRKEGNRPKHSAKPTEFATRIHWLWPDVPKVELFARDPHPAFDAWGDQVTNGGIMIPQLDRGNS